MMSGCDRESSVFLTGSLSLFGCALLIFLSFSLLYFILHHALLFEEPQVWEIWNPFAPSNVPYYWAAVMCSWRVKLCLCVCVYERVSETTEKIECVFLLPVSLSGRTFDATPTVSMPFLRFDDLDNEDELLGAHKMYDFTVAVCLSWMEKLSISVCVCCCMCPCYKQKVALWDGCKGWSPWWYHLEWHPEVTLSEH